MTDEGLFHRRRVCLDGHRDQIGGLVERNRFHAFVPGSDLDVGRGEGAQDGEGQRLHRIAGSPALHAGADEGDFHACPP